MSITQTLSQDFSKYITLSYIPEQYRWLVPLGLLVLGLAMLFDTKTVWKLSIAAIGFIGGYFGTEAYLIPYILPDLTVRGIPPYLISLIVASIAAVLLYVIIKFAIAGAFAYGAYLAYTTYYPPTDYKDYAIGGAIAAVTFMFIYFLYSKLTQIIGRFVGTIMLFFGLTLEHVPTNIAVAVSVIVLLFSLYLMMGGKKKIEAMITAHKAAKATNSPKQTKVEPVKEAKHRMSKIVNGVKGIGSGVKKVVGVPKKVLSKVKSSETTVEGAVAEDTKLAEEIAQPVTHVRANDTAEEVK